MLQEYCLVRGSCFRCYRNIVWLEGVASDVTGTLSGLEGVASDVTGTMSGYRELLQMLQVFIVWLEGVASDVTGILSG